MPAAVDIVSGDIPVAAAVNCNTTATVPFNAVAGHSDRRIFFSGADSGSFVAAHPVVEDESIPATDAETAATIVFQMGMTNGETPDSFKVNAVSGKTFNAAVVNDRSIFLFAVVRFVDHDSVDGARELISASA